MTNNVEVLLESYLFPDGKSKLKYAALTEAEKKVFTKNMVSKLFSTIKNKALKVNYMGLEKTKGDFSSYPKYSDVENSIKILEKMYNSNPSEAPKEILSCVRTLDLLKKYKDSFKKAFSSKNEPATVLYVNICAALIAGTSKIISATIEYIKQPTGEYKAAFIKEKQNVLKDDVYFQSLNRFNNMDKTGQLKQLFDITTKLEESGCMLDEDWTILGGAGDILDKLPAGAKGVIAVVAVIAIVIWAIRVIPYTLYRLRKSISDHLLNLAYFLEEHADELDTNTEKGRKVKERQLRIVEKLKALGNKLSLDDDKAQKEAKKDNEKDEEESRRGDDSSSDNSDDDDILL